jgi:hypothetical protein
MSQQRQNNKSAPSSKAAGRKVGSSPAPADRGTHYTVGYAKPPKPNRFKSGISGNPNGRPKGSKCLRRLLSSVLTSKIVKREGDKRKSITVVEGMVWKQVESALKGSERAALATFKIATALGLLDKVSAADGGPSLSQTEQDLVIELLSKFAPGSED